MSCVEIRPHLEAYALDALEAYHRARVEKHLETCITCRAAAAALREVVGELPLALNSAAPLALPPALKSQVLRAAQTDAEARAQALAVQHTFAARADAPARRDTWLLKPRGLALTLSAALVVLLLMAGWIWVSNLQMQRALENARAAQDRIHALQQQQAMAIPVLNSQAARELVLTPPDDSSAAFGKIIFDPMKPTVVFLAYKLPPLTAGYTYALWTVDRGMMQSRGFFVPNRDGFAMLVFLADRNDPVLKQVLVTRQRAAELLPSTERVLMWRADPNDITQELFDSLYPRPTTVMPGR